MVGVENFSVLHCKRKKNGRFLEDCISNRDVSRILFLTEKIPVNFSFFEKLSGTRFTLHFPSKNSEFYWQFLKNKYFFMYNIYFTDTKLFQMYSNWYILMILTIE